MSTNRRLFSALPIAALVTLAMSLANAAVAGSLAPVAGGARADSAVGGSVFCNGIRRQDEIVVVSTRAMGCSCDPESLRNCLMVERYAVYDDVGYRHWQVFDLQSFLAFDASVPTIIFVHGNQITPSDAKNEGLAMYRRLVHSGSDSRSIRFVIFSWPSSRVGGLLRDVRVKATRTDPAGCQLAWLLDQMPPETPVSLVGFSYGARIITAGLHILAGGNLGHLALTQRTHANRPPMNVVLLAAALHANWLGEGQYQGLAMTQVNQMLLVNNCRDLAMRFYHLAFPGRGRPQALGLRGPTCVSFAERSKIEMRDVSRCGSQHDLFLYLCAPGVTRQIWDSAMGTPAAVLQAAN